MRAKSNENSKFFRLAAAATDAKRRPGFPTSAQDARAPQTPDLFTPYPGKGPLPCSAMKRSIRVVTTRSGTEPSPSTASWKAPSRAAATRVHALHPKKPPSSLMHHKRLMIRATGSFRRTRRCQKSAISYPRQPWRERAGCRRRAKLSSQRATQSFASRRLCISSWCL